jgi:hypothetical protein
MTISISENEGVLDYNIIYMAVCIVFFKVFLQKVAGDLRGGCASDMIFST